MSGSTLVINAGRDVVLHSHLPAAVSGAPQQETCFLNNNDDVSNGWLPALRHDLVRPSRI